MGGGLYSLTDEDNKLAVEIANTVYNDLLSKEPAVIKPAIFEAVIHGIKNFYTPAPEPTGE
jgi:hypothetical protein